MMSGVYSNQMITRRNLPGILLPADIQEKRKRTPREAKMRDISEKNDRRNSGGTLGQKFNLREAFL